MLVIVLVILKGTKCKIWLGLEGAACQQIDLWLQQLLTVAAIS